MERIRPGRGRAWIGNRPFYIHAAPWRTEFSQPASRGCVTLATGDAGWLFDWAEVGTPVEIDW